MKSGAQVILSKLPIGDVATQWFADRGLFAAGRVPADDLNRVIKATGGVMQSTLNNITEDVLGTCELFEESQIGAERYNFFKGCPNVVVLFRELKCLTFSLIEQNRHHRRQRRCRAIC